MWTHSDCKYRVDGRCTNPQSKHYGQRLPPEGEACSLFEMKGWLKVYFPLWKGFWLLQIILSFFLYSQTAFQALWYAGWVILALSIVLFIVPMYDFRKKGREVKGQTTVLVTSGSYAVVRHPIYLSFILLALALPLITQHWLIAFMGVVGMVLSYAAALLEDSELVERFGEDYEVYMHRVPRINFLLGAIRLVGRRMRE